MSETIKFLSDMKSGFSIMMAVTFTCLGLVAVVSLGALALSYAHENKRDAQIWVLEQGSSLAAVRMENGVQRDLEIINHVTRFHELLFNMAPDAQSIENNHELMLHLADGSAEKYFQDQSEQNFYKRLVQTNSNEMITVDSVKVDISRYPYRAAAYAHLYIVRESTVTSYDFLSTMTLTETTRTAVNPNGLMIENFFVERNDRIETRKRR